MRSDSQLLYSLIRIRKNFKLKRESQAADGYIRSPLSKINSPNYWCVFSSLNSICLCSFSQNVKKISLLCIALNASGIPGGISLDHINHLLDFIFFLERFRASGQNLSFFLGAHGFPLRSHFRFFRRPAETA